MSTEWFYELDGVPVGPMTTEDLKRHAMAGRITENTLVTKSGKEKWYPASKVQGLLPKLPVQEKKTGQEQFDFPSSKPESSERSSPQTRPDSSPTNFEMQLTPWIVLGGFLVIGFGIFFWNKPKPLTEDQSTRSASISTSSPEKVEVSYTVETENKLTKNEPVVKKDAEFRKSLFDDAFRAAVEFKSPGLLKIKNELEILEPAIRGEDEENVFKLLKMVEHFQAALNGLWVGRDATMYGAEEFDKMAPAAKDLMRRVKREYYDEFSAMSAIAALDGFVIKSSAVPELEQKMNLLVNDDKISKLLKFSEYDGVKFIDFEKSKATLHALEQATIKTIGELLNNKGRPIEK